jgi:ElaB/YqjD/DUF883 family membrane-anchored ribosome-binding protein
MMEILSQSIAPWIAGHPLLSVATTSVVAFLLGFLTSRALSRKEKH